MLKIGIIGCGKITQVRHAPEYAENPNCEIIAFCDLDIDRAKAMADKFGGRAFASPEELILAKPDAVSVCAANTRHAEITVAALHAGAHVLCEKPMATTLEECESMTRAANKTGRTLVIGHNQRFAAAHVKAREMIERGEIGRPLTFRTTFGHAGPEGWTGQANSWFFSKRQAAFGALADLGAHKIDVIHYLLGDPITEVSAFLSTLDKKYPNGEPIDVDDDALCFMKTKSGVTGTLHASWVFYGREDNSTLIYGSEGVIRCYSDPAASLILETKGGLAKCFDLDPITTNEEQVNGIRRPTGVIDDFVSSILSRKKSVNDGESAIETMRVIFAALASNENAHSLTQVSR